MLFARLNGMIEILYKDKDIVVCIKPVGALSEKSGNKNSVPKLLCEQLCIPEVYSVHRLDRNVGGIMVYALNSFAASALIKDITDKRTTKEYAALIMGEPDEDRGVFTDLLFHDSSVNKTYIVDRMRKGVRDAKLEYAKVMTKDKISLMRIKLYTGRTHQIRVQFASRKMPLVGDGRYGSRDSNDKPCLYSFHLSFTHPRNKKQLDFISYPDFSKFGFSSDDCLEISKTVYLSQDKTINKNTEALYEQQPK